MNRFFIFIIACTLLLSGYKKNINHATFEELDSIAGVGKIKANFILKEIKTKKFDNYNDFYCRTYGVIGPTVRDRIKTKYDF